MAIYLTARFHVKPGARARCEQAIRELVEAVQGEAHTWLYTSVQETTDAARFLHFFILPEDK